ncbi:Mitochondrial distribution and morphology protein 31, mitochondrial precursor [Elasticomyces elasticus]|nr:Mitochondrial distribution and morphology protein 31, mitochondrial precursor [Elasticomyces elasticus]
MSRNVWEIGGRALLSQTASRRLVAQYGSGGGVGHRWLGPAAATAITIARTRSVIAEQIWMQRRWKSDARRPKEDLAGSKPDEPAKTTTEALRERLPHMPHLPHRPTKDELLSAATGILHRAQIRFKYLTIRSARPFNSDEIFAFASWIFYAHIFWLAVFTTSFLSLAIYAINTVFAQETLAGWVGEYLTRSSGVRIVFESAIVPAWRDGVITFSNVFVSRRPGGRVAGRERAVSKGSSTAAAAQAALAERAALMSGGGDEEDEGNYTQFDATISQIHVTLSFTKWFNGRGLLDSVSISGVRGVVDRTNIRPIPVDQQRDPKSYRHEHKLGDFEIGSFRMEDVLLTVYQPRNFRPFTVSVFNCELPRLRKQWLFYDFLSANNMSGSFDDSLFTIHPRQIHSTTLTNDLHHNDSAEGVNLGQQQWKKHSRMRIDGLSIDHLNRGVEGPFGWIQEGNVDIVADVSIPFDEEGGGIAKVVKGVYDQLETAVVEASNQISKTTQVVSHPQRQQQQRGGEGEVGVREREGEIRHDDQQDAEDVVRDEEPRQRSETEPLLILDLSLHLNSPRAALPALFPKDLSYVNAALIRPIVAYINSRPITSYNPHTNNTSSLAPKNSQSFSIPIQCRIIKGVSEFDGSWTVFDSGLMGDLSREVYEAFANDVNEPRRRARRVGAVVGWGVGWLVGRVGEALVMAGGLGGGMVA